MKRKAVLLICTVLLFLTGCQNAESDQEIEDSPVEEVASDPEKEQADQWDAEELYTADASLENAGVEDILLTCTQVENGNNRIFVLLRDGNVYCANMYNNVFFDRRVMLTEVFDETWDELSDVYCLGRISSEELNELEDWIDRISPDARQMNSNRTLSTRKSMMDKERFLNIYGTHFSDREVIICWPGYTFPIMTGEESMRDGMWYYDDPYSVNIIEWFENSSYLQSWDRHISETGTDKNASIQSDCVNTYRVLLAGTTYPDDEVFRISTEEELEYTKEFLGLNQEACPGLQMDSTEYPVAEYDYLLHITYYDGGRDDFIKTADSVRYDSNGHIYFHDSFFGRENAAPFSSYTFFIPELYVDIAVVPKGVLDENAICCRICTPQEIDLKTVDGQTPGSVKTTYTIMNSEGEAEVIKDQLVLIADGKLSREEAENMVSPYGFHIVGEGRRICIIDEFTQEEKKHYLLASDDALTAEELREKREEISAAVPEYIISYNKSMFYITVL